MKIITGIFVLFALVVIVEGAWLAAASEIIAPIVLSCGAMFAVKETTGINTDTAFFDWKGWWKDLWKKDDYVPGKVTFTKEELDVKKQLEKVKKMGERVKKIEENMRK